MSNLKVYASLPSDSEKKVECVHSYLSTFDFYFICSRRSSNGKERLKSRKILETINDTIEIQSILKFRENWEGLDTTFAGSFQKFPGAKASFT